MNKKAIATEYMMYLVLAVVTLVVLALFYANFYKPYMLETNLDKCEADVKAAHATNFYFKDSNVKLRCPTHVSNLSGNYNEEKVYDIFAQDMKKCFDKMGKGEFDPFSKWFTMDPYTRKVCVICNITKFNDDFNVDSVNKPKLTKFSKYLAETKIKDTDRTYFEYFLNRDLLPSELSSISEDVIDTNISYAVIFQSTQSVNPTDFVKSSLIGTSTGTLVGISLVIVTLPVTGTLVSFGAISYSTLVTAGIINTGVFAIVGTSAGATYGASQHEDVSYGVLFVPYDENLDCNVLGADPFGIE